MADDAIALLVRGVLNLPPRSASVPLLAPMVPSSGRACLARHFTIGATSAAPCGSRRAFTSQARLWFGGFLAAKEPRRQRRKPEGFDSFLYRNCVKATSIRGIRNARSQCLPKADANCRAMEGTRSCSGSRQLDSQLNPPDIWLYCLRSAVGPKSSALSREPSSHASFVGEKHTETSG